MNRLNLLHTAVAGILATATTAAFAQTPAPSVIQPGKLRSISTPSSTYSMNDGILLSILFNEKPCGFVIEARNEAGQGHIYQPIYPTAAYMVSDLKTVQEIKPKDWGLTNSKLGKVLITVSPAPAARQSDKPPVPACAGNPVRTEITLVPPASSGASISGNANLGNAASDPSKSKTDPATAKTPNKAAPARY